MTLNSLFNTLESEFSAFGEICRDGLGNTASNKIMAELRAWYKYAKFLTIIQERVRVASANHLELHDEIMNEESQYGSEPQVLSPREQKLHADADYWRDRVKLDIESIYIFADILLDTTVRFYQSYFGSIRSIKFKSYNKFIKSYRNKFLEWKKHNDLTNCEKLFSDFAELIIPKLDWFQNIIGDYRDKHIVHSTKAREIQGIKFNKEGKSTHQLVSIQLYPESDKSTQVETEDCEVLMAEIFAYLIRSLCFMRTNLEQSYLYQEWQANL